MIGIYKITNPKNKVYIGQSVNIIFRWKNHQNIKKSKDQPKLHNSILKYGIENHKFEIIQECLFDELNELERYYQELYNCIERGLNCKLTETSTKKAVFSNETKMKISKSLTGKKLSEEHKHSLSKAQTGLKRSKEAIEKSVKSRFGRKDNDYTRKIKSNMQKGKNNSFAKTLLNTQTGIFYETAIEAAESLGWPYGRLSHYLNGRLKNKTNLIYV
jgi:group I intron endonuclease